MKPYNNYRRNILHENISTRKPLHAQVHTHWSITWYLLSRPASDWWVALRRPRKKHMWLLDMAVWNSQVLLFCVRSMTVIYLIFKSSLSSSSLSIPDLCVQECSVHMCVQECRVCTHVYKSAECAHECKIAKCAHVLAWRMLKVKRVDVCGFLPLYFLFWSSFTDYSSYFVPIRELMFLCLYYWENSIEIENAWIPCSFI